MQRTHIASILCLSAAFLMTACPGDDVPSTDDDGTGSETAGDGDGDAETSDTNGDGDGDGDPTTGDGDGDPTTGDGDGDPTTGDGDGDPTTGDGDGDPTTGDGDGDGDVCGDGMVTGSEVCDDGVNDGSYGGCNADCLALGPNCGDNEVNGDEVCDDGVNDNSYGGCAADCLALGPNCGDSEVNGDEVCDDGVNDGSYGSCAADCLAAEAFCGDGMVNGPETCDDANADLADGCLANCTIPNSCLDIHTYDDATQDGVYQVAPQGYDGEPFDVYCDMTSDGGGYTFLKLVAGSQLNAAQAEGECGASGMQLWIPRSLAHKNSGWTIANDANIGQGANPNYMRILGIYPSVNGATCANQPMNSGNMNCGWKASDDGPWYVHEVNNISEPNGDNNVAGSMYYQWQNNGDIQWHNDIGGAGYTSQYFMCDVGDKLP